jgi:hypothetical protein
MWIYENRQFEDSEIDKYIGFVYLITNKTNNRKYVGKKLFWFTKTRTIKGKKKREKSFSDWKMYWSSSEELKGDVKNLGEENFTREILHLCMNKGTMSYLELREQIDRRVLEKNEYYNAFVGGKIHKSHVKL